MINFEPKYKSVQKHHLNAVNQFKSTGLTAGKYRYFLTMIKPLFHNWFKLVKYLFKLVFICLNAVFHNWFKLVVSTGLTGLMRLYIEAQIKLLVVHLN